MPACTIGIGNIADTNFTTNQNVSLLITTDIILSLRSTGGEGESADWSSNMSAILGASSDASMELRSLWPFSVLKQKHVFCKEIKQFLSNCILQCSF